MAKAAKKAAAKKETKAAPKKAETKATASKKAAPKKEAPKKTATASKKSAPKKSSREPNAAFMAPLSVSPEMQEVIGNKAMPRTEIIKKIWEYIKKHDLQDSKNKRMINADDKLKKVFGGKNQVSMFELAKIVNNHVQK